MCMPPEFAFEGLDWRERLDHHSAMLRRCYRALRTSRETAESFANTIDALKDLEPTKPVRKALKKATAGLAAAIADGEQAAALYDEYLPLAAEAEQHYGHFLLVMALDPCQA